jgi:hypothetical protein
VSLIIYVLNYHKLQTGNSARFRPGSARASRAGFGALAKTLFPLLKF